MNDSKNESDDVPPVLGPRPARVTVKIRGTNVVVDGHPPRVMVTGIAVTTETAFSPSSPEWSDRQVEHFRQVRARTKNMVVMDQNGNVQIHRAAPPSAGLRSATDWFPSPKTRKLLTKFVADQLVHIEDLAAKGRWRTARWQWCWTWMLLFWYGGLHAVSGLSRAIRGKAAS